MDTTRSDIVKILMGQIGNDDIVIASTGYISREVFKYDRCLNFYVMGAMGNALAIGIGIALHVPNRVFVINGDGSALMSLGTMVTMKSLNLKNLYHFIIDNGMHESTGGQLTSSRFIDFKLFNNNTIVFKAGKDDSIPPRITISPKEMTRRFSIAITSGYKRI